jgi:hypothetical protein
MRFSLLPLGSGRQPALRVALTVAAWGPQVTEEITKRCCGNGSDLRVEVGREEIAH